MADIHMNRTGRKMHLQSEFSSADVLLKCPTYFISAFKWAFKTDLLPHYFDEFKRLVFEMNRCFKRGAIFYVWRRETKQISYSARNFHNFNSTHKNKTYHGEKLILLRLFRAGQKKVQIEFVQKYEIFRRAKK